MIACIKLRDNDDGPGHFWMVQVLCVGSWWLQHTASDQKALDGMGWDGMGEEQQSER